jgi:hypothetical protein
LITSRKPNSTRADTTTEAQPFVNGRTRTHTT